MLKNHLLIYLLAMGVVHPEAGKVEYSHRCAGHQMHEVQVHPEVKGQDGGEKNNIQPAGWRMSPAIQCLIK